MYDNLVLEMVSEEERCLRQDTRRTSDEHQRHLSIKLRPEVGPSVHRIVCFARLDQFRSHCWAFRRAVHREMWSWRVQNEAPSVNLAAFTVDMSDIC